MLNGSTSFTKYEHAFTYKGTKLSFQDFAGSSVVHIAGGTAALVGAKIVGARTGRFQEDGTIVDYPGHSITVGLLKDIF